METITLVSTPRHLMLTAKHTTNCRGEASGVKPIKIQTETLPKQVS